MFIEIETDCPGILQLQWALGPNTYTCISRVQIVYGGVEI